MICLYSELYWYKSKGRKSSILHRSILYDNIISQVNEYPFRNNAIGGDYMDLGMPTLIENRTLEENARLCNALGLDFIELNMNLPMFQTEQLKNTQALQTIAERYQVYYTIHLDENCNVTDFNPMVADAYINTVIESIRIAKEAGIPLLNLHMNKGVYFTLPHQKIYLFETFRDRYLEKIK